MHFGESSGESSSSTQENGAAMSDSTDRPHKKARFPWQIKGKHRLKNQTELLTKSPANAIKPTEPEPVKLPSETADPISYRIPSDSPLPLEIVTSHAESVKSGYNEREIVLALSESVPQQSSIKKSSLPALNKAQLLEQDSRAGPSNHFISTQYALKLKREEDRCISRWQATQTIIGCFENAINYVRESMMSAATPTEDSSLVVDLAQNMNQIPQNDDNVENEGILMAINAHGLRNVRPPVIPIDIDAPGLFASEELALTRLGLEHIETSLQEEADSSFWSEDFEIACGRESSSAWPSNDTQNENTNEPVPYQYLDRMQPPPGEDSNEYEFMNTAVNQAIMSKGLMAAGTDFG